MAERRPFEFRVGIDGKDARKGASEVADALEDIGRAADGVDDQISSIGDGTSLSGLETVTRQMRRSADDIREEGRKIGRATERVKDDIKEDLGPGLGAEAGQELIQNFGETIASGSLDLPGLITGTLGGLVNSFGQMGAEAAEKFQGKEGKGGLVGTLSKVSPGMLAGALGVVGIGIAIVDGLIAGVAERDAAFKAVVEGLFQNIYGAEGGLSQKKLFEEAVAGLTPGEQAEDWLKYKELKDKLGLTDAEMYALLTGTASPELEAKAGEARGQFVISGGGTGRGVWSNPAANDAFNALMSASSNIKSAAEQARIAAEAAASAAAASAGSGSRDAPWEQNPRRPRRG